MPCAVARPALQLLGVSLFLGWLLQYLQRPGCSDPQPLKHILLWEAHRNMPEFHFTDGRKVFLTAGCKAHACRITRDKAERPVDEFDLVVINANNFALRGSELWAEGWSNEPPARRPSQRYVFFLLEPPPMFPLDERRASYDDYFNWTMTYRLDSDIPRPYGWILPRNGSSRAWMAPRFHGGQTAQHLTARKTQLAAWMASHCTTHSQRERYVRALSRHVSVHVYGACGDRAWPRARTHDFYRMLDERYKFYLAFENALCRDYVTEKLFNVLRLHVVPVVYGGADYARAAPPMSYIDVADFASARALADYLLFLDRNPREYAKYFWWKKHYSVSVSSYEPLCRLCELLHAARPPRTRDHVTRWWNSSHTCREPKEWPDGST